jgi:DnaA family protein
MSVDMYGFSHCDLLAIDNLDAIAGISAWEMCFYQLINRCRDGDIRLIYSMSSNPMHLDCEIEDFKSRLLWGLLLQLADHSEDDIRHVLTQRAKMLGMKLSPEVISYLLTHHSRNLSSQMEILRLLDNASLIRQQKVTIPLVKQVLDERPSMD